VNALLFVQTAAERLEQARQSLDTSLPDRLMGLVGIATMLAVAYALSANRRRVQWKLVGAGVALQGVLGVIVLKTGIGRAMFDAANEVFKRLLGFTSDGAAFIFGKLVYDNVPIGTPVTP